MSKGESLVKEIPLRFYKTFSNLSITIDSTQVTISQSLDKKLIGNHYIPQDLSVNEVGNRWFFTYLKRKILKYLGLQKKKITINSKFNLKIFHFLFFMCPLRVSEWA